MTSAAPARVEWSRYVPAGATTVVKVTEPGATPTPAPPARAPAARTSVPAATAPPSTSGLGSRSSSAQGASEAKKYVLRADSSILKVTPGAEPELIAPPAASGAYAFTTPSLREGRTAGSYARAHAPAPTEPLHTRRVDGKHNGPPSNPWLGTAQNLLAQDPNANTELAGGQTQPTAAPIPIPEYIIQHHTLGGGFRRVGNKFVLDESLAQQRAPMAPMAPPQPRAAAPPSHMAPPQPHPGPAPVTAAPYGGYSAATAYPPQGHGATPSAPYASPTAYYGGPTPTPTPTPTVAPPAATNSAPILPSYAGYGYATASATPQGMQSPKTGYVMEVRPPAGTEAALHVRNFNSREEYQEWLATKPK